MIWAENFANAQHAAQQKTNRPQPFWTLENEEVLSTKVIRE
jgi:hypothetical protein